MKDLAPLVLCAGAAWFLITQSPKTDRPTPEPEAPVLPATPLDASKDALWWEALARRVEGCQIDDLYKVVQVADQAIKWGDITDDGRLAKARIEATKEPFTEETRARAAALLRGAK